MAKPAAPFSCTVTVWPPAAEGAASFKKQMIHATQSGGDHT